MTKAIIAALLALLASCAVAHADAQDDQFLSLLASHGIQGAPDQSILAGHESCDALDQPGEHIGIGKGPYRAVMLNITAQLSGQGLSTPQMWQLVDDARSVYCPGKA